MNTSNKKEQDTLELLGGIETIRAVNKAFYDLVYQHPWLKLYFNHIPQQHIENQQTDFMVGAMGGPQIYSGRLIFEAHMHIHITEELFIIREELLQQAFLKVKPPAELINRWTKIDNAFKNKLIKKSIHDCQPRYHSDEIISFENPLKKSA